MKGKHGPRSGTWLITGGLLLIGAALLLSGYNVWDAWRAGVGTRKILEQMPEPLKEPPKPWPSAGEREIPDYILNPDMEMPTVEIDGNFYIGKLELPVLGLSLPVMDDWSYPKLRVAPCRYTGSAYKGNMVIAAHNYSTHFGLLKTLSEGDPVTFTDVDGNVFAYEVAEIQVLDPTAVEEMSSGKWELSLFTCTLGGQTRLTVRCRALK